MIKGIKLSSELVLLKPSDPAKSAPVMGRLREVLSKNGINMPFVTTGFNNSCAVSAEDMYSVHVLTSADEDLGSRLVITHGVGLLSIFPHRSSFKVLGLSMEALANAGIPILGMASSLAALTFVVGYGQLDAAAGHLADSLKLDKDLLPTGNSTGGKAFPVAGGTGESSGNMETSAAYRESEIKIYGFQETEGLGMLELSLDINRISGWGASIRELEELEVGFTLVWASAKDEVLLEFCFLFENRYLGRIRERLESLVRSEAGESLALRFPVELIGFQGPHFGDRCGIAEAAFGVLKDNGVSMLGAACSGAVVNLVMPEGGIRAGVPLLGRVFSVPSKARRPEQG